jgi:hypothetical protein
MQRILRCALAALVLVAVATGCTATQVASAACVNRSPVATLTGPQGRYPLSAPIPEGSAVNATGASWAIAEPYPVNFESVASNNICFVGGSITSLNGAGTAWSVWHGTAGMVVKRPDFQLISTRFHNVGDGVRWARGSSTDWAMRGVRMQGAHDDCVENDTMHSGLIDDSLFDGCFVFYSARGANGSLDDGSDNIVTITDSLVRLEPMTFPDRNGGQPGHGPLLKLSASPTYGRSPQMVIKNTIIRFDQAPSEGAHLNIPAFDHDTNPATPGISYLSSCENNTIVWLGDGPFPGEAFPSCFTVTTDPAVWDDAVAQWEAAHPA